MQQHKPDHLISVLIPFGGDDPYRKRVLEWLEQYYHDHLCGVEFIIGRDKQSCKRRRPMPFSKAAAVNDAFRRSRGDIIVILDADCYIDTDVIQHWAERLRRQRQAGVRSWAVPYRFLLRLTERATSDLICTSPCEPFQFPHGAPPCDIEGSDGSGWGHVYGALIQIVPREAFIFVGGMDERFRGWGGEDRAFLLKLDALWGRYQNSPNTVYHMWHPKIIAAAGVDAQGKRAEIRAWENQPYIRANDLLSAQYDFAKGNADKMRLISRGGKKVAAPKKAVLKTTPAPAKKVQAAVKVQPLPVPPAAPAKVPASWTVEFKKIAGVIAAVGTSLGAVLAVVLNVAPSVHVPAPEITILIAVSSIVAAVATEAGSLASAKMAARKAAKKK